MTTPENVFRADKSVVPEGARSESGPGKFTYVTVAEWESQAAIEAARSVVMANHAQTGFNASEMITRLGIEADIANYKPIDA